MRLYDFALALVPASRHHASPCTLTLGYLRAKVICSTHLHAFWFDAFMGLRYPDSLSSRYHDVDGLHAALHATVDRSGGSLSLDWLRSEPSQVEGDDDGGPLELAVLRTVSEAPGRRLRALILFGEHAREAITSEVALRVASALAGEVGGGDDSLRSRAAALRSRVDFALMPLVNVRGRRLFEGGDFCRRGNARNVDLNRNWRTPQWGGRETEHALHDCNPGPAPFSEPESQAVAAWARTWRPDVFLCVHSGQLKLLTPLAHSFELPPHHEGHERVIRALNLRLRRPLPWSRVGRASAGVGYVSRGTSLDWFYLSLNASAAFAFEIGDWPTPPSYRQQQRQHRGVPASALMPAFPGRLPGAWLQTGQSPVTGATPEEAQPAPLPPDTDPGWLSAWNALQGFPDAQQALRSTVSWFEQNGGSSLLPRGAHGTDDPGWCLTHFNPSSDEAYETTVADWSAAVLTLVACATDDVDLCGPDVFGNAATVNDTFSGGLPRYRSNPM